MIAAMRQASGALPSVLIVEDDPVAAELERRALQRSGLGCAVAARAAEAIALLRAQPFGAVLLDYRLEDQPAWAVLEAARARSPAVPVVIVTAMGDERVASEAIRRGATDYVMKVTGFLDDLGAATWRAIRQAEAADARAQVASLVDASEDAIIGISLDGAVQTWNQAAERLYERPEADAVGQPLGDLLSASDRAALPRVLEDLRAGRPTRRFETTRQRASGDLTFLTLTASPVRDGSGAIIGGSVVARDTTEQRQAEEQLRRHAEEVASLYHDAPCGYHTLDRSGIVTNINDTQLDWLGLTREAVVGKPFADLLAARSRPRFLDAFNKLDAEPWPAALEVDLLRADGSVLPVLVSASRKASAGREAGETRFSAFDISATRHAQQALQTSESWLRRVIESSMIGIFFWDVTGQVLDANDAFLRLVGHDREDVEAGRVRWDSLTPPAGASRDLPPLEDLLSPAGCAPFEWECQRSDGKTRSVVIAAASLEGSPDRGVAFMLDISERKSLEDQLRQAQRLEILGRLAGGIAHDFNNLLTPILGYCEILGDMPELRDVGQRELGEIRRAGERALTLTQQLLAFSRKRILTPGVMDPNAALADMSSLLGRLLGEDVTLVIEPGTDAGRVRLDPGQFEQVVMNLAVNARDAMPAGGTLRIVTEAGSDPTKPCRITVSDTGTGMDPATVERIFEPFFTTKPSGKGTGLGLATVHGIVHQAGGSLRVNTALGRGTTFTIELPRAEGPVSPRRAPERAEWVGGSETVLLVEDDAPIRTYVSRVLAGRGYTVIEASHGLAALEALDAAPGAVHLLLADVVMPELSGPELAARARARRPDLRVLYMSGYTEDAAEQRRLAEAGDRLLEKPFTPGELLRRVREALG